MHLKERERERGKEGERIKRGKGKGGDMANRKKQIREVRENVF